MAREVIRYTLEDGSAYVAYNDGKVYRRWPDGSGYLVSICRSTEQAVEKAKDLANLKVVNVHRELHAK